MKTFLFIASLLLAGVTLNVSGQEPAGDYRQFTGLVRDSKNQPVSGASVCGWDLSGRPINGRIPCVQSQKDGSFSLNLQKWEGDKYRLWVSDLEKGYPDVMTNLYEDFLYENRIVTVDGKDVSKPIEFRFGQVRAGKLSLNLIDDVTGQRVEKGAITLCRLDNSNSCQKLSTSFPQGVYEFLTPQSAFTIKMQWWDGQEWKDWTVLDRNRKKIETLQVELGQSQTMTIKLKK